MFDALFAPVLLYSSEVWGAYDSLNLKKWEKDPIERFHSQFYKSYLGLNRRAPNVAARNETGRLPLKLIVFSNIIKFWLHLLKLPSSSVAGQCLQISTQLADSGKKSFMLTMYDMLKQYSNSFHSDFQAMIDANGDELRTKQYRSKVTENFKNDLKIHQYHDEMIKCNKKLTFYSTSKTDETTSNSLELITNQKHRRAVAKLRAGNHNLRIETGRHSTPKLPEHLRICQYCSLNEVENEANFILFCNKYDTTRNSLDIISKYPEFDYLNANNKIVFLFNSTDAFICKRLSHFIYEAFSLRNESLDTRIVN